MVAFKGWRGPRPSASKAALESLTRTWAAEFGTRHVRVNSVAPGPTATEGVIAEWGDVDDELRRALPLGRTVDPREIAEAGAVPRVAEIQFRHRFHAARRRRRRSRLTLRKETTMHDLTTSDGAHRVPSP